MSGSRRRANAAEPMLTWGVLPARPRVACGLDMRHRMIHRFVPGNHPEERLRPCEEPEGCDDYHVAHVTITLGWVHVGNGLGRRENAGRHCPAMSRAGRSPADTR